MKTKQQYTKETIAKIKADHPKDKWQSLILASKTVANTLDDPPTIPCHVETDDMDLEAVRSVLNNSKNYITRYLRAAPTVGLGRIPARNTDGAVIEDAPHVYRRVICAGVPYACMIAFLDPNQDPSADMLIGWSKRIETNSFIESQELGALFQELIEGTLTVAQSHSKYPANLRLFGEKLAKFMSCQQPKDTEISFSKAAGRQAAIARGLRDSIEFQGKYVISAKSGPVPNDIGRSLPQFIKYAEETFAREASNVDHTDTMLPAKTALG